EGGRLAVKVAQNNPGGGRPGARCFLPRGRCHFLCGFCVSELPCVGKILRESPRRVPLSREPRVKVSTYSPSSLSFSLSGTLVALSNSDYAEQKRPRYAQGASAVEVSGEVQHFIEPAHLGTILRGHNLCAGRVFKNERIYL